MVKITLFPNDFRDFLSIISILGFLAIFFTFVLNANFLTNNMTTVFLTVGGLGIMSLSKAFRIKQWLKDGLQKDETLQVLGVVIGATMILTGLLFALNITIGERILGYIGIVSLFPAVSYRSNNFVICSLTILFS